MGSPIAAASNSRGGIMTGTLDLLTLTSLSNVSTCTQFVKQKSKEKEDDVPIIVMNGSNTGMTFKVLSIYLMQHRLGLE